MGDPVGLVDESVWFNAREPIAQTFTKDGDAFTVVANHFKSKSPGPAAHRRQRRHRRRPGRMERRPGPAGGVAGGVRRPAVDRAGDHDVLLLGDFNAYTQEDPIERLREAGFADLGERLDAGRYSYVFDDLSGSLDHALARRALPRKVTDLAHWNINAVESFAYQYDGDPALYAPTRSGPATMTRSCSASTSGALCRPAADHRRHRPPRRARGTNGRT